MSAITLYPQHDRRSSIGSSDVAALFNASPYKTLFELWHEKNGTLPETDLSDDERIQAGNFLEPAIAAWAKKKFGFRDMRKFPRVVQHPTIEGMTCSPDYEVLTEHDGWVPAELKNVDWLIFKRQWVADGNAITEAPLHILLQLQHQLACLPEAPYGLIIPLVGGNDLRMGRFDRAPKTIAAIETAIQKFWTSIHEVEEPKPDFEQDGDAIGKLYREVVTGDAIDMARDNRFSELCAEYLWAAKAASEAEARKKVAKAEILTKLGPAPGAFSDEFRVTSWEVSPRPDRIITPDMVGKIQKGRAGSRQIRITETLGDPE